MQTAEKYIKDELRYMNVDLTKVHVLALSRYKKYKEIDERTLLAQRLYNTILEKAIAKDYK